MNKFLLLWGCLWLGFGIQAWIVGDTPREYLGLTCSVVCVTGSIIVSEIRRKENRS